MKLNSRSILQFCINNPFITKIFLRFLVYFIIKDSTILYRIILYILIRKKRIFLFLFVTYTDSKHISRHGIQNILIYNIKLFLFLVIRLGNLQI